MSKKELIIGCVHNKGKDRDEFISIKLTRGSKKVKFSHFYDQNPDKDVSIKLKHESISVLIAELERIIKDEPDVFNRRFKSKEDYLVIENTNCDFGGILSFELDCEGTGWESIHIDRIDTINLIQYLKDLRSVMKA